MNDQHEAEAPTAAAAAGQADEQPAARPLLRVVDANATPEEVAAIVAVFSALSAGVVAPSAPPRSAWSHPARRVRGVHQSGPGAWRASGLPR